MNLLNKLTVKNLKLNKKRTIVTIVGIMLSVALITAVASVYASGLQSIINYETNEKGAFHVVFFDVPTEDVKVLKNNRGIDTINLTENIGYAMNATKNDSAIWISDNDFQPEWVPEYGAIPTTADSNFPKKTVCAHKLASITSLDDDFVSDLGFDLEQYLVGQFSKRFGKAEEDSFINGTGVDQPHGILTDAETGVTVSGDIGFDDVLALYFSVDKQYRSGGAWLMNDETALKLKTLKDQNEPQNRPQKIFPCRRSIKCTR